MEGGGTTVLAPGRGIAIRVRSRMALFRAIPAVDFRPYIYSRPGRPSGRPKILARDSPNRSAKAGVGPSGAGCSGILEGAAARRKGPLRPAKERSLPSFRPVCGMVGVGAASAKCPLHKAFC